jgi:ABC-type phosphate transport system substrate-binding protein
LLSTRLSYIALLALAFLLWQALTATAADFIIVVHRENPVQRLSSEEVRNIFLGKQTRWQESSSTITLVMNTNEDIHEKFTRDLLQKSPVQLSVYWKKILYSGTGMLPLAVRDDEAAKSYVALHKNAISYIDRTSLDRQVKRVDIY